MDPGKGQIWEQGGTIRPMARRTPGALPLLIRLEPAAGELLNRQVYRALRSLILEGRLAAGGRLPSTRALAADLGVSRNTVLDAYERLTAEGYLHGKAGGGTRVSASLPDDLLRARPPAAPSGKRRRRRLSRRA